MLIDSTRRKLVILWQKACSGNQNTASNPGGTWKPSLCVSGGQSSRFRAPCCIQHIQPPQPKQTGPWRTVSLQGPSCDQSLRARVVDGDTIDAIMGQRAETSRYIGVNTLRRATPRVGEEPGGRAASELNHGLVSGKTVELELDVQMRDGMGGSSPTRT